MYAYALDRKVKNVWANMPFLFSLAFEEEWEIMGETNKEVN